MIAADTVLRNGRMWLDGDGPPADALAVLGDRIIAVGKASDIEGLVGPRTNVIDVGGRLVIPGLHDSHIHTVMGGGNEMAVSLSEARSIKDVQAAIAARAAATPPGKWVLSSSGWHESQLNEGRLPTRHEIDAAAPDNPVLIRRGGHVATVNSAALTIAGIGKETPDPKGGVIVRDPATGEPSGPLFERAAFSLVLQHVPTPTRDEIVAGLKSYTAKLNARGITSTLEPGITLEEVAAYMELWRQKAMTTRVRILQRVSCAEDVIALTSILAPEFGDDWLRIGGFKYMADGGVEAAYLSEPYRIVEGEQNDPAFHGKMMLPPGGLDELRAMLEVAARRGWQVQVHAVGDATITAMVDLMEEIDRTHSIRDSRWAIMHVFLPQPAALTKMKQLGIYATVQDHPTLLGHNMVRYWGEERAARSIPVKSILAAGIPTAGGTDAPVVGWNPFESLWWMVTRKIFAQGKICVLGPEEAISREEALRIYTMGSAQAGFMEARTGSLEPGKLADIAVLSADYFSVPDDEIPGISSVLTLVGGRVVHRQGV